MEGDGTLSLPATLTPRTHAYVRDDVDYMEHSPLDT